MELGDKTEMFATKTNLADLRADLYRALWLQTGAIVGAVAGLLAIVQVVAVK